MKLLVYHTIQFLKKTSFFGRLFLIGGISIFLITTFIPDLEYNIFSKKLSKLSIEEISKIKKENLPRYIFVSNAQPLKVNEAEIDSVNLNFNKLSKTIPKKKDGFSYIVEQNIKKGDTVIASILYPVYSKNQLKMNPKATASKIKSFVVIRDNTIKEEDLKEDNYFKSSTFVISGQFEGNFIDTETLHLLKSNGFNINSQALVLEKSKLPMSLFTSAILTLLSLLAIVLCLSSFLSINYISKILYNK